MIVLGDLPAIDPSEGSKGEFVEKPSTTVPSVQLPNPDKEMEDFLDKLRRPSTGLYVAIGVLSAGLFVTTLMLLRK